MQKRNSGPFLIFILLILFVTETAKAQFDAQFSQYWAVTSYYNPAYAGQTERLNVTTAYSQQLSGFDNAPQTMYFGVELPFKFLGRRHGVGATFTNDKLGFFTNQTFGLQYSIKFKVLGGSLGVGLQGGIVSVGFDPSGVTVYDEDTQGVISGNSNDDAIPSAKVSGTKMDAALGVFYTHKLFYAGLSATHFMSPVIAWGETNEFQVTPVYYFTGGCNIKTKSPFLTVQPSIMVKSDFAQYKIDITGRATYSFKGKELYGGLSYSPGTSATFMVGGMIKNIKLCYSYELFTNGIGASNGSHDIVLGYSMDMNFGQKGKNKHKSVRIL